METLIKLGSGAGGGGGGGGAAAPGGGGGGGAAAAGGAAAEEEKKKAKPVGSFGGIQHWFAMFLLYCSSLMYIIYYIKLLF